MLELHNKVLAIKADNKTWTDLCYRIPIADIFLTKRRKKRQIAVGEKLKRSFGFWYFGHFSRMIFFSSLFRLALQNANKDYKIYLYFRIVAKSDQKRKMASMKQKCH